MAITIKLRRDTAANWTSTNPVLADGEPGFETDTSLLKIGDGVTAWNSLSYQAADPTLASLGTTLQTAAADTPLDSDTFNFYDAVDAILKKVTWSNIKATLKTYFDTLYAAALGPDDNYVTDAEKTVIGNTSGINTGDQDLSGKEDVSNKEDTTLDTSTTKYPTNRLVKENIDATYVLILNEQTANYILDYPTDALNTEIRFNKGSTGTITVPANATAAFPIGTVIYVQRVSDFLLTFVEDTGVTITSSSGDLDDAGKNVLMVLIKTGTDTWDLINSGSGASFADQVANTVFAGPSTGGDAEPTFRTLVEADIPSLSGYWKTTGATTITTPSLTGDPYFIGNVLIGASGATITANTRFDLRGNGTTTDNIARFADGSNNDRMVLTANGNLNVGTGAVGNRLFWDAALVRLGIGTTTPSTSLFVNGTVRSVNSLSFGAGTPSIVSATDGALSTTGQGLRIQTGGTGGGVWIEGGSSSATLVALDVNSTATLDMSTTERQSFRVRTTVANSAATATWNVVNIKPTFNLSGGTSTMRGYNYDPTWTAGTGLSTHVAYRHTSGYVAWESILSPAQITSDQNDYNPNGWTSGGAPYGASIMRIDLDANRSITSLAGGVTGRIAIIMNISSFTLTLPIDDGATGTAANRFATTITILTKESAMIVYDSTTSRWRSVL